MLTLTEAAEEIGKSKSTLLRAIKAGRLSAQRNEHGDYRVDASELYRAYPSRSPQQDEPESATEPSLDSNYSDSMNRLLAMVNAKDNELSDIRDELEDAKERLEEHREAARALMSPEDFDARLKKAVDAEKTEHKKKEQEWQASLTHRITEIEAARQEADELRKREEEARAVLKAMEKRGLIDRILNRKPTPVEN